MNFNFVCISGRVGRDVRCGVTANGKTYANFVVASSAPYKKKDGDVKEVTAWVNIKVWGALAERVGNIVTKGQMVMVVGRHSSSSYVDKKTGETKYLEEVAANDVLVSVGDKHFEFKVAPVANFSNFGSPEAEDIPF